VIIEHGTLHAGRRRSGAPLSAARPGMFRRSITRAPGYVSIFAPHFLHVRHFPCQHER
jgi:hypothetical protein